ncbi:hypothetical protein K2173_010233 [Erythroxylum novogranatense]|uniref:BRCT domain-containing protein n=1 Tax=Erythroxylum novogranatense TaxID=1862640 RepID=A0AAV8U974_9ROSI|nr:hypothetical protein K2173_010233 [Erythroxylum novogranatense]
MMQTDSPSTTFVNVRFVLVGFDPTEAHEIRSKLISGGGVDAGQYSQNCTHVIVHKIVYDDPVCVTARNDGKTVVTGLWVDHSFDVGLPLDAASIIYRPLRDLSGISGAKSLIVCLTGYQRQDRDDIMTMVSLMGAQFSKPLVANKVTHLICYKFEGEKYELARKIKKIKLVNHRWLEDCLREWVLLPEDNYGKSGHELEMMQAEAKDSEEDYGGTTWMQSSRGDTNKSSVDVKFFARKASEMPTETTGLENISQNKCVSEGPSTVVDVKHAMVTDRKNTDHASDLETTIGSKIGCQDPSTCKDTGPVLLPAATERTPNSQKVHNELGSNSSSVKMPRHSASKLSPVIYSRKAPRISPPSVISRESGNFIGSPKPALGKGFSICPSKDKCEKNPVNSEILYKEASSSKRQRTNVVSSNSKSQKTGHDVQEYAVGSSSVIYGVPEVGSLSTVEGLPKNNESFPLGNTDQSAKEIASLNTRRGSCTNGSTPMSSRSTMKSHAQDLPAHNPVTSETVQSEETMQTLNEALEESKLPSKLKEIVDVALPQNQHQFDGCLSSPTKSTEIQKCHYLGNLDAHQEEDKKLGAKTLRKKVVCKRNLGSRMKLRASANLKCPIYSNNNSAQNYSEISITGKESRVEHVEACNITELEVFPATVSPSVVDVEKNTVAKTIDNVENGMADVFDETEAPEEQDPDMVINQEKAEVVDCINKAGNAVPMQAEEFQLGTNCPQAFVADSSIRGKNAAEVHKGDKSTSKEDENQKVIKGRKKIPGRTKAGAICSVKSEESNIPEKGNIQPRSVKEKDLERKEGELHIMGQTKRKNARERNLGSSMGVEKENKPVTGRDMATDQVKEHTEKTAVGLDEMSLELSKKDAKNSSDSSPARKILCQVNGEPKLFILSGHRLQRKEFQQIIRRLKGKFCRDSHQWSYQATHFIAPDPVRRTEKFFAAAASGRWILRTDYLTSCNQAGRFLPEEPFEWHRSGLSEDGAINLEAPRKWRLSRNRTGHGAFYGMRIIVYGECIAPPLDTLKRAVNAGDGTILATSPPYTRFLASGVDYAVISPGMPRVDLWVQEFLKHEIPCVVADYLVEYVCKPGFSLERHVLYNTHAWAEKAYANLLNKAEEIVDVSTPSDDCSSSDVACEVCGCRDRGEIMLICGDESGSIGCGVGMHIDCLDPPLEDIPGDDWFCPKCSISVNKNQINRVKKKKTVKGSLRTS